MRIRDELVGARIERRVRTTSTSSATRRRRPTPRARPRGAPRWHRTTRSSGSILTRSTPGPHARHSPMTSPMSSSHSGRAVVSFHFGLAVARAARARPKLGLEDPRSARRRSTRRAGSRRVASTRSSRRASRPADIAGIFLTADLTTQVGTFASRAADRARRPSAGDRRRRHRRRATASRRPCVLAPRACRSVPPYLLCPEATTSAVHRAALSSPVVGAHGAHESLLRSSGSRHRQPPHARARSDAAICLPNFRWRRPRLAPLRAAAEARGQRRFFTAVVGSERDWLQGDPGRRAD